MGGIDEIFDHDEYALSKKGKKKPLKVTQIKN